MAVQAWLNKLLKSKFKRPFITQIFIKLPLNIIHLTPAAVAAIIEYKANLQIPETHFLRVGIKQKNANDKGLIIGFDEPTDKDKTVEIEGIKIVYHPGQALFFAWMQIDFLERDGKQGFEFLEKK